MANSGPAGIGGLTGLGTGVATALGVNVGTDGAFVVRGGDGGTPSALVGTNISGTAANLTAGVANQVAVAANTTNSTAGLLFIGGTTSGNYQIRTGSFATINPNSGTITVNSCTTYATATAAFNTIVNGYLGNGALGKFMPRNSSNETVIEAASAGLRINNSSGTNVATMTNAGALTLPLQPSFLAYASANLNNVTGNGTVYTVIFNTELSDTGIYNNATGVVTAGVAGPYEFGGAIHFDDLPAAGGTIEIYLDTTARQILIDRIDTGVRTSAGEYLRSWHIGHVVMAAADTARLKVVVTGAGADTVDLLGGAATTLQTYFYGRLRP